MKQSHQTLTSLGPIPHEIFFVRLNGEVTAFHAPVRLVVNRSEGGLMDRYQPPEIDGESFVYALPGGLTFKARQL